MRPWIALAVLVIMALGVLGRGETRAASSTDCPVDPDVCAFAERVVAALASGEVEALLPLLAPETFTCPAPGSGGLGGPFPLCDGADAGETRAGLPITRINSEGGAIPVDDVPLELIVDFNGALPDTFACADTDPADGPPCRDAVSIVFVPGACPFDSPCSMLPIVVLRAARGEDGAFAVRDVVVIPRALISPEFVGGGVVNDEVGYLVLGTQGAVRFFLWP